MATLTQNLYNKAGRHFVSLSCVQERRSDGTEQLFVFSGFLVDVDGIWFYITAGHILKDIRTSIEAGDSFDVWRLGDQTTGNKFEGTGIPFAFAIDDWLVVEDADVGLDYAALQLHDLIVQALQAGGSRPILRSAWADHLVEHDHWALVGIPSETVDYKHQTIITAKIVVVPVTPAPEPSMAGDKAQNQFFGKLADDSESVVRDVDGMSGGPVFALKKTDGVWKYGVIGVQSGWYRDIRAFAICPFSQFGLALESVIGEARAAVSPPSIE